MKLLQHLREISKPQDLAFLLIGGHAVNVHGYSRVTEDLDILIPRDRLLLWQALLCENGFSPLSDATNFQQFRPPSEGAGACGRLDVMIVNSLTFEKLMAAAKTVVYLGGEVRVVSIEHLIALKLHVLRQDLAQRRLKDFLDVVELVRANRVDLQSAEMQEIFSRYGTEDLTRRIKIACE